jgi:hypothetical protein
MLLGQRPHLGNYWGDPNSNPIGLQWLEAGLALDAPVVLGFDLHEMSPKTLSEYRARLAMLRPFQGTVNLPDRLRPDSFSATSGGTTFIALLNREHEQRELLTSVGDHQLPVGQKLAAYDVGVGQPLAVEGEIRATLDAETLRLFAVRSEPGVLWTNSSFRATPSPDGLELLMGGPADLPGSAYVAAPAPQAVLIDGEAAPDGSWSYFAEAGVLKLEYPHRPGEGTRVSIIF